jgi:transposase
VRLMPPAYVKPYVKRQKNDAADAEAICEAVTRANMRFVETKTPEQQACLMFHRTRHLFIRQQTSVINAIRAHMAEFGIVARVGRTGVAELLAVAGDPRDRRLPEMARTCVAVLGVQLRMLKATATRAAAPSHGRRDAAAIGRSAGAYRPVEPKDAGDRALAVRVRQIHAHGEGQGRPRSTFTPPHQRS